MAMMSPAKIDQCNAAQWATTPVLKSKYREVAQQWRDMAEEAKRGTAKRSKKGGGRAAG
jgi:hypothetical protein